MSASSVFCVRAATVVALPVSAEADSSLFPLWFLVVPLLRTSEGRREERCRGEFNDASPFLSPSNTLELTSFPFVLLSFSGDEALPSESSEDDSDFEDDSDDYERERRTTKKP